MKQPNKSLPVESKSRGAAAAVDAHATAELSAFSLLIGRADLKLPASVYGRLVARLFEARPPIVVSTVAGQALVGGVAAWWIGDPWLAALTIVTCAVTAGLISLLLGCSPANIMAGDVPARVASRRFSVLAFGSAMGTGLMSARGILATDDAVVHLMLVALGLSGVGNVLRNYFQPRLTLWQLVALIIPAAVAMAWRNETLYWVIALCSMFLVFNVFRIVTFLYREARDSLLKDEDLQQQNLRFDSALNNMAHGLCMFDAKGRLLVCNDRYIKMYGFSPEIIQPGITLRTLLEHSVAVGNHRGHFADGELDVFVAQFTASAPAAFHNELANGRTIAISHEPMRGGGWVATHEDITERIAAEAQIVYLARHDALTGLANRIVLGEKLGEAVSRAHRGKQSAVLCLDLDRFKSVNDALGHPIGDSLLKEVASRLASCTRETDTVARFGGDEFAIVQTGSAQPTAAAQLAQRIIEALGAPFEIGGHLISIGVSIGVSVAPDDSLEPDQLLRNADLALYRAKTDGRGRHHFFAPEMDERMQLRRGLELDLRHAITNGEFDLAFQPLVDLGSGSIQGFEALLRWQHPTRGTVMPSDFIPLAEEIGLIVPIGEWVLREACATASAWPAAVRIAVNLSPVQFKSGDLARTVVGALTASGLAPERLELEITEGVLLADSEATLAMLHSLRSIGVRIAMDDFGTGYSSLSYLRSFPFDKIKIDRSFIRDIVHDGEAIAIVRAVTGLGKTLAMSITAEGIETKEQLARVRAEGCTEAQGFLLGRPLPADAAAALITQQFQAELITAA